MASDVELTAAEIAQFRDDGFVVLREFIPADMLAELREGYDAATRGECDVDGWNQKIARGDIMQLGMPNAHIPGWQGHPYLHLIVAVGKQLLGDDIEYRYDQLIFKPPGNSVELLWHQDAGPQRACTAGY